MITDAQIDACGFRMFDLGEIARTMVMADHPTSGGGYVVRGNKREVMAQLGNAVTPPVTKLILERIFEVIGGGDFIDLFCGAGGFEPSAPILTGGTIGLVELQRHGSVRDAETDPAGTMRAGGFHHALVMRNNTARGDQGQMSTHVREPFRTLTGACHQSLVVPYGSDAHGPEDPAATITTRARLALIVPAGGTWRREGTSADDPHPTLTGSEASALLEVPE